MDHKDLTETEEGMYKWIFKQKSYPHFDSFFDVEEKVRSRLTNSAEGLNHAFWPLIRYSIAKIKRDEFGKIKKNSEPRYLMHTARSDANIYSAFRSQLMNCYEKYLADNKIGHCVIGYRRIPNPQAPGRNKSNIDFANEAFREVSARIARTGSCKAYALDIKGFFDNLDHQEIKSRWAAVLCEKGLPVDHYSVFKNLTRFRYICYSEVEKNLGIRLNDVRNSSNKRLCSVETFRNRIVPNLSAENTVGIPQGTGISDVIANLYMIDFDKALADYCSTENIYYRRYSDDLLLISDDNSLNLELVVVGLLQAHCKNLKLAPQKSTVSRFYFESGTVSCETHRNSLPKSMPFEYLGFSFDGREANLRQSSKANYYRKLRNRIRFEIKRAINTCHCKGIVKPNFKQIYDRIAFQDIRNSYLDNQKTKPDGSFESNFKKYVERAANITGNNKMLDMFARMDRVIKKSVKACIVEQIRNRR